jgi:mannose-1-phosphate guanylyltransferase/mannose-6-phosphate isomerase
MPLLGALLTFQGTLRRVSDTSLFTRPIVVTNEKCRFLAEEQATAIRVAIDVITVPVPRDSAVAIAASAHYLIGNHPDTIGHGKQPLFYRPATKRLAGVEPVYK